ncbi:hypothetical protein MNBD_GAMMA09-2044 [hydrothermal vent metagenome]|uniref:AAA+ ATPase domain-containing protein n=1 Tax=hydrothermal vent metagenome TaxID=652676 RepID=A0A3B0XZR6_9ZZZZ
MKLKIEHDQIMDAMFPLKKRLLNHGFTSTENYDHGVRCFLSYPTEQVRSLHVDGDSGRRRSAFALALANVLGASQVLYYEFGKDKKTPQVIRVQEGEDIAEEPPVGELDRILTEACAQSEAESTVLILDQLHKTRFLNHIRLHEFIQSGVWSYSDVQFQANYHNLKVFLISDEPLYHSLQNQSFRIWVSRTSQSVGEITAVELGLDEKSAGWLPEMQALFNKMQIWPTLEEYKRLAFDIDSHVLDRTQLKVSIYGWVESIDRSVLESEEIQSCLNDVLEAILQGRVINEEIEISGV